MKTVTLAIVLLFAATGWTQEIKQTSGGWCSPNVAGISGPVTFTNALPRQALVAQLPLSSLLIETDAPYLTPHPHRGRRNEPAYTKLIVAKIAELHQLEYDVIAKETASNAARLFAWGAEI